VANRDRCARGSQARVAALVALAAGAAVACAQPTPTVPGAQSPPLQERGPEQPPVEAPREFEVYEGRLIREVIIRQPVKERPPEAAPPAASPTAPPGGGATPPEAPAPQPPPPSDGKPQFQALDPTLELLARNQIRSRVGAPYTQRTVTADITRLNGLGRFRDIEIRVQLMSDGTVVLFYDITPQPIVIDVQVVGNSEVSDQQLLKEVEILIGTQVDPFQIDRGARRIEEVYRGKGYYLASVEIDKRQLDETGIVLYKVREGRPIKVTKIAFEGNRAFRSDLLESKIETTEAWLLNKGKLDDAQLDSDVSTLVQFYRGEGYLDVRADRVVRPSPNGREAMVSFVLDEGPLYTLRSVKTVPSYDTSENTEGESRQPKEAFTAEQLAGYISLKPGAVYKGSDLKRSEEAVKEAYGKLGYTDVEVRTREIRSTDTPEVDLLIVVNEGRRFKTGEIVVIGGELTKKQVILEQVQIRPERPLDASAVRDTERRLLNLNLFDSNPLRRPKVTVQPEDPDNPGYRDVTVEVAETNTGAFEFGAAIGSDSGVVGRIALSQRNFDFWDTPESWDEFWSGKAFRGGGQKFRIEAMPGDQSQTFSISLSDPTLADTDYSGSGSIYYRRLEYREYTEQRIGTNFAVGRRFGTRWTGSIPVRVETVSLDDIDADNPTDYFDVEGDRLIVGVGAQLTRVSLDDSYRPTKGNALELKAEQVIGDFTFASIRAEHTLYIPIAEDYLGRRTVLSFNTRVSYITADDSDVPVYERYYLGGRTFRGFGHRAVSPIGIRNDTGTPGDDPVGGEFLFFFGPEVQIPVFEDIFSLVFFMDTGTVNKDVALDPYRVTVGMGFRFYLRQLSPVPLAFDFAVPILREDTDRKRIFTFTVDLPF
jgi:outer membrane protein insertion porin family